MNKITIDSNLLESNLFSEGPLVLFLGQSFLSKESDIYLKKINEKYSLEDIDSYFNIFNISKDEINSFNKWAYSLSQSLVIPNHLEGISQIPWSFVFTSSFNCILEKSMQYSWRDIEPVYSEKNLLNIRDKSNLHIAYLFGNISEEINDKRPPFSRLEYTQKKNKCLSLLNLLPNVVSPFGKIIIDGYNIESDWLDIESFYPYLLKLGKNQIHWFDIDKKHKENDFINDLLSKEILVLHSESLYEYYLKYNPFGGKSEISSEYNYSYKDVVVNIGTNEILIPSELKRDILRIGTIIHPRLFIKDKDFQSEMSIEEEFRNFLSRPTAKPLWTAFADSFVFEREYYKDLVQEFYTCFENDSFETPLILRGQASSGKTIALSYLAKEIASSQGNNFSSVSLFIEKNYRRVDEIALGKIDKFCEWAEENGANKVVIIWDGSKKFDVYYELMKKLQQRGRKVIIVGTSYYIEDLPTNIHKIDIPIKLSTSEKLSFSKYLSKFKYDELVINKISNNYTSDNFLALLYYYIIEAKKNVYGAIYDEAEVVSEFIINEIDLEKTTKNQPYNSSVFADFFEKIGYKIGGDDLKKTFLIGNENINSITYFLNIVFVVGQFDIQIPYDLLLRSIEFNSSLATSLREVSKSNLITWEEDSAGNILIRPRTVLEAKILTQRIGGAEKEFEYILNILRNVKCSQFNLQGDLGQIEVDFAVDLIRSVTDDKEEYYRRYNVFLESLVNALSELRLTRQATHPRLMLQESKIIRDLVRDIQDNEVKKVHLGEAEDVINEALAIVDKSNFLYKYLQVEKATVMGFWARNLLEREDFSEAYDFYQIAKSQIIDTGSFDIENYPAVDVLLWTSENLYKKGKLSEIQKAEIKAFVVDVLQIADEEGVPDKFYEEYESRKFSVSRTIGEFDLSNKAFQSLLDLGSTAGIYLRAKQILGSEFKFNEVIIDSNLPTINDAINYLNEYFQYIKNDSQCLYLFLKLWWAYNIKYPMFYREKSTLSLSKSDWEFLNALCIKILKVSKPYLIPNIKYFIGLSFFHLKEYSQALKQFKELEHDSEEYSIGRKRIICHYLASDENGNPLKFSGRIVRGISKSRKESKTKIRIADIWSEVNIFLDDFKEREFKENQTISDFNIGFNFIGPKPLSKFYL